MKTRYYCQGNNYNHITKSNNNNNNNFNYHTIFRVLSKDSRQSLLEFISK